MPFDWWTLALQTINFLVLVWLLQRFLYRPVLAAIDARRATLRRAEDPAKEARRAAQAAAEARTAELAEIEASRRSILASAEDGAKARGERVLAEARAEAEGIVARARGQIDQERREAAIAIREQAARLAGALARGLLRDVPKPPADVFLEVLAPHLAAVATAEVERLKAEGGAIEVACQPPLDDAAATLWRHRLEQRFGAVPIRFVAAPAMLAGARISFSGSRLEASWDDAVSRAEKELTDDAQTW